MNKNWTYLLSLFDEVLMTFLSHKSSRLRKDEERDCWLGACIVLWGGEACEGSRMRWRKERKEGWTRTRRLEPAWANSAYNDHTHGHNTVNRRRDTQHKTPYRRTSQQGVTMSVTVWSLEPPHAISHPLPSLDGRFLSGHGSISSLQISPHGLPPNPNYFNFGILTTLGNTSHKH